MNGMQGTLDRRLAVEVRPVLAATAAVDTGEVEGLQEDVAGTAGRIDPSDVLRPDLAVAGSSESSKRSSAIHGGVWHKALDLHASADSAW
jgi:hypothetical protein